MAGVCLALLRQHTHLTYGPTGVWADAHCFGQMKKTNRRDYEACRRLAEIVERDLSAQIAAALRRVGDPNLVRAEPSRPRIKSFDSLNRKASKKGWKGKAAIENATDLVGFRIVCNNLQDVSRAADLLAAELGRTGISVSRQNHISKPCKGGYRGVHLDCRVPVKLQQNELNVGCEIQIRSVLQDGWARLSHSDLYPDKGDIPAALSREMERLSERLYRADKQADEIRKQIAKPRRGKAPTNGARLNKGSIAFLFERTFGRLPPAYIVDTTAQRVGTKKIRADAVDLVLSDKAFLKQLKAEYAKHCRFDPPDEDVFRWSVDSVLAGRPSALREAARKGKEAWEEIDNVYRREILSELPDSVEELISDLENGSMLSETCAHYLGGTADCSVCGETIFHSDSLAEALLDHYKVPISKWDDLQERLDAAIFGSGVETGGFDSVSLCSYHEYQASKDD